MDILDIDEALKDDSYIFLADRSHDDVSNILQQWKTNNQTQMQMQLPYSNEQAYKLNSKTFTRPKRRSQAAQNLETQFTQNASVPGATTPAMLQLEIGGLVTTNTNMHNKSFLQDTSPPSSLCSSMNNDRMNNSLITSADFSNLNFLQSTASLEQELNLTTTLTNLKILGGGGGDGGLGGYSLSDMIRDRKALETLTMCDDDGTLIKDSHIGQIDEISLTLSKTASGCSTMDNSTDSMSNPLATERNLPICNALQRTMILSEEMIGDTTFNLVDSLTTPTTDSESLPAFDGNLTFKRPNRAPALNETLVLASRQVNTTFTEGCDTPEARCETPENVDKKLAALNMESSTPLTTHSMRSHYHHNNNNNNNKTGYTPTLKGGRNEEVNLSPIVGTPQRLNTTYEPTPKMAPFDGEKFVMDTMELLEQIEQPLDGTYNMSEEHKQMQCVMDLAEAEVELLAQQGDEEQFENMLAEISKVNLNAEQLKMQKSLDSIKKRFHKDDGGDQQEDQHQQQQHQLDEQQQLEAEKDRVETTPNHSHSFGSTNGAAIGSGGGGAAANGSSSSSGGGKERLLSRRSRLYDDLNLSSMQGSNNSSNSCNSTSFIVQRRDEHHHHEQGDEEEKQPQPRYQEDNNGENHSNLQTEIEPPSFKLAERRERDRDRFRTIKITREMRQEQEQEHDIIVPCIDDEQHQQQQEQQENPELERQPSPPGRLSRRDQNPVFNNNKTETSSNNFLTYKKPKEKSLISRRPLPEAHHYQPHQQEVPSTSSTTSVLPQPRSLSRPRYISGLQKFTTVSKATSAGAGLNAAPPAAPVSTVPTGATGELKSPMGIKSKSFHNLSSNIGGGAAALSRPSLGGGLRRPGVQPSKLMSGLRGASQQAPEEDPSVFKVPKLVSGLRGPAQGGGGAKRTMGNGLARPSSGYYSLSVKPAPEADTPESLSSASSRGSLYGKDMKAINGGVGAVSHHPSALDAQTLTSKLTQVTTGATGIPKPSGLRQPTQMKRSGLPRPSSIVRR
ncbi:LOW QUALITY PROTEIN: myb-like protein P [Drosophila tropicalis]|uniref:LOW QUALITY PROTEIN: myb-like protein P n=1 Tax=Drosophila tropicalis TaxID=46794 RepID=UPI0035ABBBDF